MADTYDVIVLGVGAMGSAACYHLAKRGHSVLGIEQFRIGHDRGSSHGDTRIIRRAYFEDPSYVPLLNRAYDLWRDLEDEVERRLYEDCGLVIYADPIKSAIYKGVLRSSAQYKIQMLEATPIAAAKLFDQFTPPSTHAAIFEPDAGFLYSEAAVHAHAEAARKYGAKIMESEPVLSYERLEGGSFVVRTLNGEYHAAKLVVTGGAWNARLLADQGLPLSLHRVLLYWFEAPESMRLDQNTPCFMFDMGHDLYYGFPSIDGRTLKIAAHSSDAPIVSPSEKDTRTPPPERLARVIDVVQNCLPGVSTKLDHFATCIYTMTPDEHFVIDRTDSGIVYAGGFSGHGFKFSSVIGEILADLALNGSTKHPIDFLRARRFTSSSK